MSRHPKIPGSKKYVFLLCFTYLIFGCASPKLVAQYDEALDQGTLSLHKKFEHFFVSLQATPPETRQYKHHQKFYQEAVVELNSLKLRASAIRKNSLTIEQFELIEENLAFLTLLHKGCVTAALSNEQKQAIHTNGVDTSYHCLPEFGASEAIRNRENRALNPLLAKPIRDMFDQTFRSIMTLELAKKHH